MSRLIKEVSRQNILSGVPGMTAWDNIKQKPYSGPLPDFTGQLRCNTGVKDLGKERIIVIPESQLEAKKQKYPNLIVLGKV